MTDQQSPQPTKERTIQLPSGKRVTVTLPVTPTDCYQCGDDEAHYFAQVSNFLCQRCADEAGFPEHPSIERERNWRKRQPVVSLSQWKLLRKRVRDV